MINLDNKKPAITYPCKWNYKLIVRSKDSIEGILKNIIPNKDFTLKLSNNSAKGKFVSLNLDILVYNDDEREFIYQELLKIKEILHIL